MSKESFLVAYMGRYHCTVAEARKVYRRTPFFRLKKVLER